MSLWLVMARPSPALVASPGPLFDSSGSGAFHHLGSKRSAKQAAVPNFPVPLPRKRALSGMLPDAARAAHPPMVFGWLAWTRDSRCAADQTRLVLTHPCSRGLESIENGETLPSMPHRPEVHRWYCNAGWQCRRAHQLMIEPLCRLCLEAGLVTPATVAVTMSSRIEAISPRSSWASSAACAPTATTGSTRVVPRARQSARMAPLPTRTIRGMPCHGRRRPSKPKACQYPHMVSAIPASPRPRSSSMRARCA